MGIRADNHLQRWHLLFAELQYSPWERDKK